MTVAPDLTGRLAKLLRLACSNGPDGERLAAIGRLSATAAAYDIDWDQAFSSAPTREQMMEIFEAGVRQGIETERAKGNGDWTKAGYSRADEVGDRADELEEILNAAARSRSDDLLTGWYATFSADMEERFAQWGIRTRVSGRQWEFLEKLRSILERQEYL